MRFPILAIPLALACCAADAPAPPLIAPGSIVIPPNVAGPFLESVIICGSGMHPTECVKVLDYATAATVKQEQKK